MGHANFFKIRFWYLSAFFSYLFFKIPVVLHTNTSSDNYQSRGAAEGRRSQQHPYFYALRSHGFRVKSTILPSQFLATIFSGRIAPLEQAVEYVFFFKESIPCTRLDQCELPDCESMWISLRTHSLSRSMSSIILRVVYHSTADV